MKENIVKNVIIRFIHSIKSKINDIEFEKQQLSGKIIENKVNR